MHIVWDTQHNQQAHSVSKLATTHALQQGRAGARAGTRPAPIIIAIIKGSTTSPLKL